MTRRVVKSSKINDLGETSSKLVSVVSTGRSFENYDSGQKYFKRNYLDALKKIIPQVYFDDEIALSGQSISYTDQIINSHILAAANINTILPVSSLASVPDLSALNTQEGIARFFYKQNVPNIITPDDFERNILGPLGSFYRDFDSSSTFLAHVKTTLAKFPVPTTGAHTDLTDNTRTSGVFASDSSGTHKFLIENLGWIYFLNREGPNLTAFDPSSAVAELITTNLWAGRPIEFVDCINIFQEYLWRLKAEFGLSDNIIPIDYVSGANTDTGQYTSGTQLLDRLKTLNEVVYSPHYLDSADHKVKDAFIDYLAGGGLIEDEQAEGPLVKFLQAMSFSMADRITEDNELNILYDIGKCPDQYLELLADLIGWRLIGVDPDKWRVQLRNAVEVYKKKGTKSSIQTLLDLIFSQGVFNVVDGEKVFELWESYLPDLLFYSLATKSEALKDSKTYTPELAKQFGVTRYSNESLEQNIKLLVDKIIFDLMLEFPDSFFLGNKPYPTPRLTVLPTNREVFGQDGRRIEIKPEDYEVWFGPYHLQPDGSGSYKFRTGSRETEASKDLRLWYHPDYVYRYRGGINYIPPYEKRQFYSQAQITPAMLERIEYYLKCYGVPKAFAEQVTSFITTDTNYNTDIASVINNFVIFTKERKYAPNYDEIVKAATGNREIDQVSLLTLWNGKSSHFLISLAASSFDFSSRQLNSDGSYGVRKLRSVVNEVAPAHAIPDILLTVSDTTDSASGVQDNPCYDVNSRFTSLYEGSSHVAGYAVCAVAMNDNRFKRTEVDNIDDSLFDSGGNTYLSLPRNSLRRRNFRNLLPETRMVSRNGTGSPGKLETSSTFWSTTSAVNILGFIPSSLDFAHVPTKQNTIGNGIGTLLDYKNVPEVWDICENLNSSNTFYGVDTSNTFPFRQKQELTSSDCVTYGRRNELDEIMASMHRLNEKKYYLQASSIVSGYYNENGSRNKDWPSTNSSLTPVDLSAWMERSADPILSIGNHLINNSIDSFSIKDLEHFEFGKKLHSLYKDYTEIAGPYKNHPTNSSYDLVGGPNIFSHTFGPYIYNHNLDVDGSAIDTSAYLQASSAEVEVDISFYDGSGVLSEEGIGLGTVAASTTADVYVGKPEFRNEHIISGIELVDTSSTSDDAAAHPIFSVFRLSRNEQSKYSFANYLINNTILKYHRSTSRNKLPRIRVKIDNSDSGNDARNFLSPGHEYEVKVTGHNLALTGREIGGQSLGMWVHTENENGQVFSYVPKPYTCIPDEVFVTGTDYWERSDTSAFAGRNGISKVAGYTQVRRFEEGNLNNLNTSANTPDGIRQSTDYRCYEPLTETTIIEGTNPDAIINISEKTRQTLTYKFRTVESPVTELTAQYQRDYGQVHRNDQKYVLEFFAPTGDEEKFIVIESIEITDLTRKRRAVVSSQYGEVEINVEDMRAIFRYFNSIRNNLASRDAINTSATFEASGGSRLNYRNNANMGTATQSGGQYTVVTVYEG
jgi:hypothetical protein